MMWRRMGLRLLLVMATCLAGLVMSSASRLALPVASASGPGACAGTLSPEKAALASASGQATIRLSRTSGTVGTALTVDGAGWPGLARVSVDVYVSHANQVFGPDIRGIVQVTTTADGQMPATSFHAPGIGDCVVMNPLSAEGGTVLFVAHTPDNLVRATVAYTYLPGPQVKVSPNSAEVRSDTPLILSGARWEPGQRITISTETRPWSVPPSLGITDFKAAPVADVVANVDASGSFVVPYQIPREPPETQVHLVVRTTGTRFGDVVFDLPAYFDILPDVTPSITVNRSTAQAGDRVTVAGEHWLSGQTVQIENCRGAIDTGQPGVRCDPYVAHPLLSLPVDSHGRFTAHIRLPEGVQPGTITLQARALNADFGLMVYAQGQRLTILYPFALAHPRLARVLAALPLVGGVLLVVIVGVSILLVRRRRRRVAVR